MQVSRLRSCHRFQVSSCWRDADRCSINGVSAFSIPHPSSTLFKTSTGCAHVLSQPGSFFFMFREATLACQAHAKRCLQFLHFAATKSTPAAACPDRVPDEPVREDTQAGRLNAPAPLSLERAASDLCHGASRSLHLLLTQKHSQFSFISTHVVSLPDQSSRHTQPFEHRHTRASEARNTDAHKQRTKRGD